MNTVQMAQLDVNPTDAVFQERWEAVMPVGSFALVQNDHGTSLFVRVAAGDGEGAWRGIALT